MDGFFGVLRLRLALTRRTSLRMTEYLSYRANGPSDLSGGKWLGLKAWGRGLGGGFGFGTRDPEGWVDVGEDVVSFLDGGEAGGPGAR